MSKGCGCAVCFLDAPTPSDWVCPFSRVLRMERMTRTATLLWRRSMWQQETDKYSTVDSWNLSLLGPLLLNQQWVRGHNSIPKTKVTFNENVDVWHHIQCPLTSYHQIEHNEVLCKKMVSECKLFSVATCASGKRWLIHITHFQTRLESHLDC